MSHLLQDFSAIMSLPFMIILIGFIGYLRSSIDSSIPKGKLDLDDVNKKWIDQNSWLSRFTPIFSIIVIFYNVLIWVFHGLMSIIEFTKFLFSKIWWGVMWVWNEVLHPTLFFVCKLLWHYLIIFCWKFFCFSFSKEKQKEVYAKNNMWFSFKTMLKIFSLLAIFSILILLFNLNIIISGLLFILFIVFIQYQIFTSTNFFTNSTSSVRRKMKIIGASLLSTFVFFGLLCFIYMYSDKIIIKGLGVTVAEISTPLLIISSFLYIISTIFLAPFLSSSESSFNPTTFAKAAVIRTPKYLYSLPFHVIGLLISSVLCIIVVLVMSNGIEYSTKLSVNEWQSVVMDMRNHIPEIKKDKKGIRQFQKEIIDEDSIFELEDKILVREIEAKQIELERAQSLRDLLVKNNIFTFKEEAYVGEKQNFSFLEVLNAKVYQWSIISVANDSLILKYNMRQMPLRDDGIKNTYVFKHKWRNAGEYRIEVSPKNNCGFGNPVTRTVIVKEVPITKMSINSPKGNNTVCAHDTVKFYASKYDWMESWEWDIPNDYKIISNDNQQEITIVWGDKPGTVRVRAHGEDVSEQMSIWAGLLVNVEPKVGSPRIEINKVPDEENILFNPERPFYYYTVLDAETDMAKIIDEKADLIEKKKQLELDHTAKIAMLNSNIATLFKHIKELRVIIFGTILAILGFILLLSLAFMNLWTYFVNYNYQIYSFEEEGEHYIVQQSNHYRAINPNQPMLGWYVILFLCLLAYLVSKYYI